MRRKRHGSARRLAQLDETKPIFTGRTKRPLKRRFSFVPGAARLPPGATLLPSGQFTLSFAKTKENVGRIRPRRKRRDLPPRRHAGASKQRRMHLAPELHFSHRSIDTFPQRLISCAQKQPSRLQGTSHPYTVAALRFPGTSCPPIAPHPRNKLAFSATGSASLVSTAASGRQKSNSMR